MDDIPFCPKCSIEGSPGCVDFDDAFVENANFWIRYWKCLNCGWRLEKGPFRRFANAQRPRNIRDRKKLSGRDHRRQTNTVARYGKFTW